MYVYIYIYVYIFIYIYIYDISSLRVNSILAVPTGHIRLCHVLITRSLVLVVRSEVKKSRDTVYGTHNVIKFQQNSIQL